MASDLVMLDEGLDDDETEKRIAVVLSDSCMLNGSALTIPLNEALSIAANIAIQVGMLI